MIRVGSAWQWLVYCRAGWRCVFCARWSVCRYVGGGMFACFDVEDCRRHVVVPPKVAIY